MKDESQDDPERSSRGLIWTWVCWLSALLLVYVLSTGPLVMMLDKNIIRPGTPAWKAVTIVYAPFSFVEDQPLLRGLFGMYFHLWSPDHYDSRGDPKH